MEVVDKLAEALDDSKIFIIVFLDLSKAFDTLTQYNLHDKLDHYSINGLALECPKSYLSDRFQQFFYTKNSV